jgi:hypothetical protein
VKSTRIRISSPVSNYEVPFKGFPPGIIRVTLTDALGLPLTERLVFFHCPKDVRLNISDVNKEYRIREKVKVGLSMSCDSGSNEPGNFSLSAAEDRYADPGQTYPTTIASWFLLESDISGPIEEPSSYFDPDNADRKEDLDLLLLTHGWRDFVWKYDSLNAYQNENGFDITGRIKSNKRDISVSGLAVTLGIFGMNNPEIFSTMADSLGNFRFENVGFSGEKRALLSSVSSKNERTGIISVDPPQYKPAGIDKEPFIHQGQNLNLAGYYIPEQGSGLNNTGIKKYRLNKLTAPRNESETERNNITYHEDENRDTDPSLAAIILRGFDEPRIFYSPRYNTSERKDRRPDNQTTIFWEPNIRLSCEGTSTIEFFNADTPGTISIIAEGITESGIPVSRRISYSVK